MSNSSFFYFNTFHAKQKSPKPEHRDSCWDIVLNTGRQIPLPDWAFKAAICKFQEITAL